jgi:hypothetical protein
MKNYRLTYGKWEQGLELKVIFTTIIQAKSIKGAVMRAKNLAPLQWDSRDIISLEDEWNLKLDRIEFNY